MEERQSNHSRVGFLEMSKPPKPVETYKMTLSSVGANKGKLRLEWENTVAEVPLTVK